MKKLFAIMFLVGCVATLKADYYDDGYDGGYDGGCPGQYNYQQGYGYGGEYPSYDMQPMYQGQSDQTQGMMQGYRGQEYQDDDGMYVPQYRQNQRFQDGQQGQKMMYGQDQGARGQGQGDDQKLTSDIQNSLRSRFSDKYNNVNAMINNGTVTLTGTVATQEDKKDLEEKVRGFDAVKNVNNQVMVQQPQQAQGKRY